MLIPGNIQAGIQFTDLFEHLCQHRLFRTQKKDRLAVLFGVTEKKSEKIGCGGAFRHMNSVQPKREGDKHVVDVHNIGIVDRRAQTIRIAGLNDRFGIYRRQLDMAVPLVEHALDFSDNLRLRQKAELDAPNTNRFHQDTP